MTTEDGDGDYSVFTITRTLPTGIAVSDDPQRVYFRTVNGTAVGGTVAVKGNAGPEKDKYTANNFLLFFNFCDTLAVCMDHQRVCRVLRHRCDLCCNLTYKVL